MRPAYDSADCVLHSVIGHGVGRGDGYGGAQAQAQAQDVLIVVAMALAWARVPAHHRARVVAMVTPAIPATQH